MRRIDITLSSILCLSLLVLAARPAAAAKEPRQGVVIDYDPSDPEFICRIVDECCTAWPCSITGPTCCEVNN